MTRLVDNRLRRRNQRATIFCAVGLITLTFLGCGNSDLGSVTGTVTLDGAPLAGAQVTFMPTEGGGVSFAEADSDGTYKLIHADGSSGAVIGSHMVSVELAEEEDNYDPNALEPEDGEEVPREPIEEESSRLPARYNDESELTAEVKAGSNEFNWELESS